jgi:hypothetical protein
MDSLTVYSVYCIIVCSDNKVMVTNAAVPNAGTEFGSKFRSSCSLRKLICNNDLLDTPYGGGLEYLHRCPASRKRRQKGNPVPGDITGPPCSWGI